MALRRVQQVMFASIALALSGASALAQRPVDTMAELPGLFEQAEAGTLRCPDGTTRPWKQEQPASELVVNMACAQSAEETAQRAEAAAKAMAAKNAEAEQRAALRGDAGVVAGLKASFETGSLEYILSFRLVWFALAVGGLWVIGAIVNRLLRGGR